MRTAYDVQVDGRHGSERPRLTWKKLTENDCHKSTWRSAMHAVSQLHGMGPTDGDDAPAH